ncbi:37s ribosomal rsm22 [Lecanosticta acicola]|uniref:37s ribosomal rsm22 n=1 Tax=Lecanosticta acicola TaxID=111012 RepID=A0AAI8YTF7_9PEZI|nr:37s ribosomal rsm22 [Lecanosticta acicola]
MAMYTFKPLQSATVIALLLSLLANAVSLPGCQGNPSAQKTLDNVKIATVDVPARPFGVTYFSPTIAFVAFYNGNVSTVGVLDTQYLTPKLVHQIPLPARYLKFGGSGIALTKNHRYLLVTAGIDTFLVDSIKAATGHSDAVVAVLNNTVPNSGQAVEVTALGDYAFVSQESSVGQASNGAGSIEVFKIPHRSNSSRDMPIVEPIGAISLGSAVVGSALSKDNRYLYVTREGMANKTALNGTLSVLDVETLKRNPSRSLLATIPAGCEPVRVAVHPDGKTVWVTVRGANSLIAFVTDKILSDPDHALLAVVEAGENPVGLAFAHNGKRILTADSSRFNVSHITGLTVFDTDAALRGDE